ncbi:ectoine/hydroxyectoine ABC transporter permease subunit EhuD [Mesorhizobium sp. WSM4312]|uniref:ectoine/hydroxyectoine ABC transporter permease subunit EhuD n=1 Tax=unclassified Mesorhizobium TaxID=325217 RepID=UPI000BAF4AD1|nr:MULTISPECIES: ectoine/hydroxyectoine ABC transporter permease subunit EhuD [unclassified Mesorhizobium]PBB65896.1 ectoine/hydroxyectoine ABC transporter permease subunit EhuD [Mesorhizobium sp. WSM4312]PBC20220.1 ectoine/hydroxyectoine ABC transporter permease subunit EhuD [Mesorhizobium sp. WSM4311]TRC75284.1 ectoine/hydroxyectoine ABC transporter permease subunit EhuD [Mesorhizobium sp. WSM4310]TRC78165.1 ectoine/hydroxyectoine ABC transporter permease subunit EhuD [Mesorhizobium sp. WSM43
MGFDVGFALSTIPIIVGAIGATLFATVLSCVGASAVGFTFEIIRRSGGAPGFAVRFLIDFIRSTPVLAWLYFIYFVLPFYGIRLGAMTVGVLALSLYYSGYLAEVFKAGIDAIPKGQQEAARALSLSRRDTVVFVIAPQMLRNIAAPLGNYLVSILKATPYLAVLAVPEMLGRAFDIASETYRYAEPLTVAGLLFLALALVVSYGVKRVEQRLLATGRR